MKLPVYLQRAQRLALPEAKRDGLCAAFAEKAMQTDEALKSRKNSGKQGLSANFPLYFADTVPYHC